MSDVVAFPQVSNDGPPEVELELEAGAEVAAGDVEVEIEVEVQPELEVEPEPALERQPGGQALLSTGLVEILPPDFELPLLAKFIPNPALRTAVSEASEQALAIDVKAAGGLALADEALALVRARIKAVEDHLEEPISIAHGLHKRLTGIRADWTQDGRAALAAVGARVFDESERRKAAERERLRLEQAEADRKAREEAQREADLAAASAAPAEVVEQLQRQVATTTAPPVSLASSSTSASGLRRNSTTKTWKARIVGTGPTDAPNPDPSEMTPLQRENFRLLCRAIADQKADISAALPNYSYLNKRAGADKSAMGIPGVEAYQVGGTRAKGGR